MTQELAVKQINNICESEMWAKLWASWRTDPSSNIKHRTPRLNRTPSNGIVGYELTSTDHNGHFESGHYLSQTGELYHVTVYPNNGPVCIVQYYTDPPWSDETLSAILAPLEKLKEDMLG